jgi:putative acetyltransferase
VRDQITITQSSGELDGLRSGVLAELIAAYHLQTEAEKGVPVAKVAELPERYRREVEDPKSAFRGQSVFVARIRSATAGCLVVTPPLGGCCEIKRLWTDPAFRGQGVASRLIEVALSLAVEVGVATVRLTVWQWRAAAIAVYERFGFVRSAPWEDRQGLVCMQRTLL